MSLKLQTSQIEMIGGTNGYQVLTTNLNVEWIDQPVRAGQVDPYYPIAPNQSPARQLDQLIREFGIPILIDPSRGGSAIWKQSELAAKGYCWYRAIIYDLPVDFIQLEMIVPFDLARGDPQTQQLLINIRSISPHLSIVPVYSLIRAYGNDISHVIAILLAIKRYVAQEINLEQARELIPFLFSQLNPYSQSYQPQLKRVLQDEVCEYLKQQERKIKQGGKFT